MRGLVWAGGSGARLLPMTLAVSKQLLPIYDKPMIYYPLCIHLLAGIRDILILSTPHDTARFQQLLGDGSQWGVNFCYAVQPCPEGLSPAFLPQALLTAAEFIGNNPCSLVLGDNIFYGDDLSASVQNAAQLKRGARLFAYPLQHPKIYSVVAFDQHGKVFELAEKPSAPKSSGESPAESCYAVTGLYYYDATVCSRARDLRPSQGELTITDLNRSYLDDGKLFVEAMSQGMTWLDMGDHDAFMKATKWLEAIEKKQGLKVCCPEEISWRMGNIGDEQLARLARQFKNNAYGQYLSRLLNVGLNEKF